MVTLEDENPKGFHGAGGKSSRSWFETATSMAKSMERDGWIVYYPRIGVSLTRSRKMAMNMLCHRLLETW